MSWLSSLLGQDAQHNAGVAQGNATSQQNLQNQYGAQAANLYSGLNNQGQFKENVYQGNYLQLLDKFAGVSGLGNPIDTQGWRAPDNPAANGGFGQGEAVQGGPQGQGGMVNPNDPYSLDTYQQQQLNQTNANIAHQQKSAIASGHQQLINSGITDPRAHALIDEQLGEHFAGVQAKAQAEFYETAKKDKQQALAQLIAQLGQFGSQGISEQEAAGSGYLGLASGAQAASNAQQNFALQQQQLSNDQFGGFLNLVGFGLGGGFNRPGGGAAKAPASVIPAPVHDGPKPLSNGILGLQQGEL